jgi:hypothetical protein
VHLPQEIFRFFPVTVRERGESYFRRGAVELIADTDTEIDAAVTGGELYAVQIRNEDGLLALSCTCPFADEHYVCKHLWATLLEADRINSPVIRRATGVLPREELDEMSFWRDSGLEPQGGREAQDDLVARLHDAGLDDRDIQKLRFAGALKDSVLDVGPRGISGSHGAPNGQPLHHIGRSALPPPTTVPKPRWQQQLLELRQRLSVPYRAPASSVWPADRRIIYVVDVPSTKIQSLDALTLQLFTQTEQQQRASNKPGLKSEQRRLTPGWSKPKQLNCDASEWLEAPDPADREVATMLLGARPENAYRYTHTAPSVFTLSGGAVPTTLRRICDTGRAFARIETDPTRPRTLVPLDWDDGEPWELVLTLQPVTDRERDSHRRLVGAVLRRGEKRVGLAELSFMSPGLTIVRHGDRAVASRLRDFGSIDIARALRDSTRIEVPDDDVPAMLAELFARPARAVPPVEVPPDLGVTTVRPTPKMRIIFSPSVRTHYASERFDGALFFDYEGVSVAWSDMHGAIVDRDSRRVVFRDAETEAAAVERLERAGFKAESDFSIGQQIHRLPASRVPRVAAELTAEGWHVELEGQQLRTAGEVTLGVTSGIDWFDLHAVVDFGGISAGLPQLLAALQRGERIVSLGDGSLGVLSEEWLERFGSLMAFGPTSTSPGGHVRFGRGQVALLDALLATLPSSRTDEMFERARD